MKCFGMVLLLVLSIFFACNSDEIATTDEVHSGLVEKITEWNDVSLSLDYLDFTYNTNRLVYFTNFNGGTGKSDIQLTYNSEGGLIAFNSGSFCDWCYTYSIIYENGNILKLIYASTSTIGSEKIISELNYNNSGQLLSKIDTVINTTNFQDTTVYNWEFEFDTKGNISTQQKFDASGNLIEKLILEYDNFKNPFHGLHTNYDGTFELITSPNNIIKEIHQYGDEVIGTVFIFDYDSNGFPVKYEIRDIRDVDIPYNYPFYKINYRK